MSRRRRPAAAVRREESRRLRLSAVDHGNPRRDRGMVILETAIAIPVLAAVAMALAWVVSIGGTALALGDTVRSAARELARGEAPTVVLDRARERDGAADFDILVDGGNVTVSARRDVAAPLPLLRGLTVTVARRAEAPMEWT